MCADQCYRSILLDCSAVISPVDLNILWRYFLNENNIQIGINWIIINNVDELYAEDLKKNIKPLLKESKQSIV